MLVGVGLAVLAAPAAEAATGLCLQECAHGFCPQGEISYTCTCENGHSGPDCSVRRCPVGKAWTFGDATTVDHEVRVECSNMGTCNAKTGLCSCRAGFHGAACQYLDCPNGCSGHGQCLTRQEFEYLNYRGLGAATLQAGSNWIAAGPLPFEFTEWDADMIQACVCDLGWEGFDCSAALRCPKGDDPLTLGQRDEVQVLECTCADGTCDTETFRLGFRRTSVSERVHWTADISALATAAELEAALVAGAPAALSGGLFVQVGGLAASAVDPVCSSAGTATALTFTHTPGNLDPLLPLTTSSDASALALAVLVDGANSTLFASGDEVQALAGKREYITCSGRGYCVDGEYCSCLDGFESSSGAVGQRGGRADCGYFARSAPTDDDCPRSPAGDACFGHGTCVGYAKVCVCDPGYAGRQCQARECEAASSFFEYIAGAGHGDDFFCSNRGTCDADTGACECMGDFVGAACEQLSCAVSGSSECGDHGTCATLEEEAVAYGNTYSAWDATRIKGCVCDTGVYVGPFAGSTADASGYLCDQLSCPVGDDPMSPGVVEAAECSNRGVCDRAVGHCKCFAGFCSSNGTAFFAGTTGDCSMKSMDCK